MWLRIVASGEHGNKPSGSIKCGNLLTSWKTSYYHNKKNSAPWSQVLWSSSSIYSFSNLLLQADHKKDQTKGHFLLPLRHHLHTDMTVQFQLTCWQLIHLTEASKFNKYCTQFVQYTVQYKYIPPTLFIYFILPTALIHLALICVTLPFLFDENIWYQLLLSSHLFCVYGNISCTSKVTRKLDKGHAMTGFRALHWSNHLKSIHWSSCRWTWNS
jgi:hypothetical protein